MKRRTLLQGAAITAGALAMPFVARAQASASKMPEKTVNVWRRRKGGAGAGPT